MHVGDLPFRCHYVNTLSHAQNKLLLVDGSNKTATFVIVEGILYNEEAHCDKMIFTGLAKLLNKQEAEERYAI